MLPRSAPIVLIFEQHSFSSGSEIAERLIRENWCHKLCFELPSDMTPEDIKAHYQKKIMATGFATERAALDEHTSAISALAARDTELNIKRVLSVRQYFSAKARLKLLAGAEEVSAQICPLDLTFAKKEKLYKKVESAMGKIGLTSPLAKYTTAALSRNEHMVEAIGGLEDVPLVCILGIQHAHDVISKLRAKDLKVIPCYVEDAWAPKALKETLYDSYPPALRAADGLLEFTSVAAAMETLRDQLLSYTIMTAIRTEAPTSLTSLLSHTTGLPFYSVRSRDLTVSALTTLSTPDEKTKATSIQKTLGQGSFFTYKGEAYFGLAGINLSESSSLPKKIYDEYRPKLG